MHSTIIITSDVQRWHRLERYARTRTRRFPLLSLPGELLLVIARHLDECDDLRHLLEALVGFRPSLWKQPHLRAIPPDLRSAFVVRASLDELEKRLTCLSETALYYCRDCQEVIVLANWSAFSSTRATAVARVRWTAPPMPRRDVKINAPHMATLFWSAMRRRIPVVRLTLHSVLHWHDRHVFSHEPLVVCNHALYPHTLLNDGGPSDRFPCSAASADAHP